MTAKRSKESPGAVLRTATVGAASSLRCRISNEMVERFSQLTGDRSSLHSSVEFARRSRYRQQVVHGMLPVAFVSAFDFFKRINAICMPVELTGHFLEPVYAGDELLVSGEVTDIRDDNTLVTCAYVIEKVTSGTAVVRGTIQAKYLPDKGLSPPPEAGRGMEVMTTEPLKMREQTLEEISVKSEESFGFQISEESIQALIWIVSKGLSAVAARDDRKVKRHFYYPNLLSIMLFSPSVGMCIPGKYATFLGFESKIDRPIRPGMPYRLKAFVMHVSKSTRIIRNGISIGPAAAGAEICATGKVSILVNAPPARIASVREMKEAAIDLGLKDKVVLVTGASRGIGETTAKLFALLGAKVIVNYFRGSEDAGRIVQEIRDGGGEAVAVQADVSVLAQVQGMVQEAIAHYGTIDILVNNAVRDFRPVEFLKLSWEDIQGDIDVILKGSFHCAREIIPLMIRRGGGKIVNIGTVATDNPPPQQLKYVVSKSGLVGLTRSLAAEFAASNIQINLVVPSFIETDLVSHIPDVYRKKIARETPMQRNASPLDVARAVVFAASSYASYTTGQKIMVTGGGPPYL